MVANTRLNNLDNCLKIKQAKLQKTNEEITETKKRIHYNKARAQECVSNLHILKVNPRRLAGLEERFPGARQNNTEEKNFYTSNYRHYTNRLITLKNILNKEKQKATQLKNDIAKLQSTKREALELNTAIDKITKETFNNKTI